MNSKLSSTTIIISLLILSFFVWGLIGANQASSIGVTCDMGIGDNLCWQWHTNTIGQIQQVISDLGNN